MNAPKFYNWNFRNEPPYIFFNPDLGAGSANQKHENYVNRANNCTSQNRTTWYSF